MYKIVHTCTVLTMYKYLQQQNKYVLSIRKGSEIWVLNSIRHKYFWVKIVNMTVYYIISMKVHNPFSNYI